MATTFGDNIRKYRERKGLRQEDLAIALGYKTKGAVNKIERNVTKLPQDKIKKCADILGVEVADLFTGAEPVKDPMAPFMEYLPYLAQADEKSIDIVRAALGMEPILRLKKSDGASSAEAR